MYSCSVFSYHLILDDKETQYFALFFLIDIFLGCLTNYIQTNWQQETTISKECIFLYNWSCDPILWGLVHMTLVDRQQKQEDHVLFILPSNIFSFSKHFQTFHIISYKLISYNFKWSWYLLFICIKSISHYCIL